MRTKNLLTTMALIMTMSMGVGCGKQATAVIQDAPATETSTQETVEATDVASEETSTTLDYVKPNAASEETSQEEFVFTNEYAAKKLEKMKEAYDALIASDGMTEYSMIWAMETGEATPVSGLTTSDCSISMDNRDQLEDIWAIIESTMSYYYNSYVNNDGEYFDFADYISNHSFEEIIYNF